MIFGPEVLLCYLLMGKKKKKNEIHEERENPQMMDKIYTS
jgi:hypothetical protein